MTRRINRQFSRMSPAARNEAHRTYFEETLFEAVVTAAAIVALADKHADASERSEFARFIQQSRWLSTFTPADAIEAFDSRIRQLEMTGNVLESEIGGLQRVSDNVGICEIVHAAELVALADGCMEVSEAKALGDVKSALRRSIVAV